MARTLQFRNVRREYATALCISESPGRQREGFGLIPEKAVRALSPRRLRFRGAEREPFQESLHGDLSLVCVFKHHRLPGLGNKRSRWRIGEVDEIQVLYPIGGVFGAAVLTTYEPPRWQIQPLTSWTTRKALVSLGESVVNHLPPLHSVASAASGAAAASSLDQPLAEWRSVLLQ